MIVFEQGMVPEGPRSFHFSDGMGKYIEDQKKRKITIQSIFSTKNPKDKSGKAIGSGSCADVPLHLGAAKYHAAGDKTTWG
jgi:hypothetical protein